jgi:dTDP-4-dehydrorhamnose 3,5-epimerase
MLAEAKKSRQTVTADGDLVLPDLVEGVRMKEIRNIVARTGVLTELWRPEWLGEDLRPGHVVYVTLAAFGESNWHCHRMQRDLLFVVRGSIKIALYDDRTDSATYKRMNVLGLSNVRPTLLHIPPGVWHGLKNMTGEEAAYVTMNDRPYRYEDPDDWRLPPGDKALPSPF